MVVRNRRATIAAILAVVLSACRAPELGQSNASARAMRAHARHLAENGEVGEAIAVARQAARLAPAETESWILLGRMHGIAGDTRNARVIEVWCVMRTFPIDVAGCLSSEAVVPE
jgi:Flp pilus assembly protein TadD